MDKENPFWLLWKMCDISIILLQYLILMEKFLSLSLSLYFQAMNIQEELKVRLCNTLLSSKWPCVPHTLLLNDKTS